ncbi:MAG: Bug family tripartite tricarboxylate transporter substrate binding protein [Alphaproteobacteria bacterium]
MKKTLILSTLSIATLFTLSAAQAADKSFEPSRTINWTVTSSPGGGSDIFTRKIAEIMTNEDLVNGQKIIITNKTDGSGEIGRNEVAHLKRNPDYRLLTFNSGDLMPMVENTRNRSSDFRILAVMAVDKQLIFKGENTKYNTFQEVIDAAKSGTKVVLGGSKGDDIATYRALIEEIGLDSEQLTYITYDSTGGAITAALGGHVELVISKPAAASEYVTAGSLKPILALATERYTGNLADAPTLSEVGDYANVEVPIWRGVAAPKAMSDEAAEYWSNTLNTVSQSEAWKNGYINTYKLVPEFKDTNTATEYVTGYEAKFMEEKDIK